LLCIEHAGLGVFARGAGEREQELDRTLDDFKRIRYPEAVARSTLALAAGRLGRPGLIVGDRIGSAYFGQVRGFATRRVRHGETPELITIDGFLTEGIAPEARWPAVLPERLAWRHVTWECKRLDLELADVSTSAWHVAMTKAHRTGQLLANALVRAGGPPRVLVGFSLGARVIAATLDALADAGRADLVAEAHLLGGAVGADAVAWRRRTGVVAGSICNYLSKADAVLRVLYRVGTLMLSEPVGRRAIRGVEGVVNVNVTDVVPDHAAFKSPAMRRHLRGVLGSSESRGLSDAGWAGP